MVTTWKCGFSETSILQIYNEVMSAVKEKLSRTEQEPNPVLRLTKGQPLQNPFTMLWPGEISQGKTLV